MNKEQDLSVHLLLNFFDGSIEQNTQLRHCLKLELEIDPM